MKPHLSFSIVATSVMTLSKLFICALFLINYVLRSILSSVTNCPLVQDEKAWLQASLPVKLGGLGIRRAVQVAPSAYLSSTAATSNLVTAIPT